MKRAYLIIACIVALIAVYLFSWWLYTRLLRYKAQALVVEAEPYVQQVEDPRARVLVIGDSIALGVGVSAPERSIVGLLGRDYPDVEIVNASVSGLQIREAIGLLRTFREESFDVVFLHVGGNDVIALNDPADSERYMNTLITEAGAIADDVVFVSHGNFLTVPALPLGLRWIWQRRNIQQRELYYRLAETHDAYVADYYRAEDDLPRSRIREWYAADRFHLSDIGHFDAYTMEIAPVFRQIGL